MNDPQPFAKLFDTPDGQLLAYIGQTDDFEPAIIVIGAPVNDVIPKAILSGWDDDGTQRAFDKIDQANAESQARALRGAARGLAG